MAEGRASVSAKIRASSQTIVSLDKPKVVERRSGHIAELGVTVISEDNDTIVYAKLTREELVRLVELGQKLLAK
jgi:hypothetical protein